MDDLAPPRGVEQAGENVKKTAIPDAGGAECGAVAAQGEMDDPDLARVIAAWPRLTNQVRKCIAKLLDDVRVNNKEIP
jgi:hypothetical protein